MSECKHVTIKIPVPPSVNTYWGFHGHRRFLTKKAVEFKNIVSKIVSELPTRFFDDRLRVGIVIHFPDRRRRDLDNVLKSGFDAMVQAGLFNDDSQIDELTVKRGEVIKGGLAIVTIQSL